MFFIKGVKALADKDIQLMRFLGTYSVVQYSACLGGSEKLGGIFAIPGRSCQE